MVIAIVGHPAAGKDLAAEYFAGKGFHHISSGDIIREIMQQKDIPTDRAHVHIFSKEMRAAHGNSFPAEEVVRRIKGDTVVSGLRTVPSVDVFRKEFPGQFHLIAVHAPIEARYKRAQERQRIGDNISFEQFKEEEDRERNNASGSHEVDNVIAAADAMIENNGTKEEFFGKLEALLEKIR